MCHAINSHEVVEVGSQSISPSALHGRGTLLSSPAVLPHAKSPCIYWIRSWVGPRASLDPIEETNLFLLPGNIFRYLGHRVYTDYTDRAIQTPTVLDEEIIICIGL
jgi:hypothetical protein